MRTRTKLARVGVIAAIAASVAVGTTACTYQNTSPAQACTVEDKGVTIQSKSTVYKVWTDCGVFVVKDTLVHGNWNSADLYGQLDEGHTYKLETFGPRNGFLSLFPNIVSAEEVAK